MNPLASELWGIRRFFVRAPCGTVINNAPHSEPRSDWRHRAACREGLGPGPRRALAAAREQGWKIAMVSNGTTSQQTRKIQKLGIDPHGDAVVISEAEGVKKPDPEIFRIAARRLGLEMKGGCVVGDHPVADIAGGRAAGLETGRVSRGMAWPEGEPSPTVTADTVAEVLDVVVRQRPG